MNVRPLAVVVLLSIAACGKTNKALEEDAPSKTDPFTGKKCPPKSCHPVEPTPGSYVKLVRPGGCMISGCPAYSVTLMENGDVIWNGEAYVATKGHAGGKVDAKIAREIMKDATSRCFFSLDADEYFMPITDHSTAVLTVAIGGQLKTVKHNVNGDDPAFARSCIPLPALEKLEMRIDDAANTAQWIGKR